MVFPNNQKIQNNGNIIYILYIIREHIILLCCQQQVWPLSVSASFVGSPDAPGGGLSKFVLVARDAPCFPTLKILLWPIISSSSIIIIIISILTFKFNMKKHVKQLKQSIRTASFRYFAWQTETFRQSLDRNLPTSCDFWSPCATSSPAEIWAFSDLTWGYSLTGHPLEKAIITKKRWIRATDTRNQPMVPSSSYESWVFYIDALTIFSEPRSVTFPRTEVVVYNAMYI